MKDRKEYLGEEVKSRGVGDAVVVDGLEILVTLQLVQQSRLPKRQGEIPLRRRPQEPPSWPWWRIPPRQERTFYKRSTLQSRIPQKQQLHNHFQKDDHTVVLDGLVPELRGKEHDIRVFLSEGNRKTTKKSKMRSQEEFSNRIRN